MKPDWYQGFHAGTQNRPRTKRAKRNAPEHRFQVSLVKVLRKHALTPWHSIPNGGFRHLHTAVKLKAEGSRKGAADLLFILPPHGQAAYLELKAKDGSLSQEQQDFRDEVRASGALWEFARTIDEAYGVLTAWKVLSRGFDVSSPQAA
jgi:hypothetical protein